MLKPFRNALAQAITGVIFSLVRMEEKTKMRILLDTNIIIPLEDPDKLLDKNLADMRRLCSELHWELLIHPMQDDDLARDEVKERREIVKSRCAQYSRLPAKLPPRGQTFASTPPTPGMLLAG